MTAVTREHTIDQAKLETFVGKGVSDFAAMLGSALVVIGDKLGLYRAMAGAGPLTSAELAERTDTAERYIRDWLINQAAGGYIDYDPPTGRYTLPDEHAIALTSETSPFFLIGAFQASAAVVKAISRLIDVICTGDGMRWGEPTPTCLRAPSGCFARLQREPGDKLDTGARWRGGHAPRRRTDCGYRLRPRRFDDHYGPGL